MDNMKPEHVVLVVGHSPQAGKKLAEILDVAHFRVLRTTTCQEALAKLYATEVSVVICDRALPDGSWKDILKHVGPHWSTSLIVTERLADNYLWAEVLNLGGFDVLAQPFDGEE